MSQARRRNITISVDEDVARWTRVKAAQDDVSIGQFVGELLRQRMQEEVAYASAMQEHFAVLEPRAFHGKGERRLTRDELHYRAALRS